jgi:hypothetical protein
MRAIRLRIESLKEMMESSNRRERPFDRHLMILEYINSEPSNRCPNKRSSFNEGAKCYDDQKKIVVEEFIKNDPSYIKQCNQN